MDDGRPTDSDVLWAARQVVRQHNEPPNPDRQTGMCAHCGPDGCWMFGWAMAELASPDQSGRSARDGTRTDDSDALTTGSTVRP